jgi:cellulose synthase/poly-beta-1,6-N-acetylglucosamine synthase-like glycosyltransferase
VSEELVAFVDDDCLVETNWLDAVWAAFRHPSRPSFVTGQVSREPGARRRAWVTASVITDPVDRQIRPGDDPKRIGHGANSAWRRQALDELGGFDETFGPGGSLGVAEDLDLFSRALDKGMTGYYAAGAVVVHRAWRSRPELLRVYHAYGIGAGALAVKEYRKQRASGRAALGGLLRSVVVDNGVAPVVRALRRGHEMGAVADMCKFAGALRGAWRARRYPVAGDVFVERPQHPRAAEPDSPSIGR